MGFCRLRKYERWNKLVLKIIHIFTEVALRLANIFAFVLRGSLAHYSDDLEVSFVISLM